MAEGHKAVSDLTVTYAATGLVDFDSSHLDFFMLTTPSEQEMSIANWTIWARKGDRVVSERKNIDRAQLRPGETYDIELIVEGL